MVNRRDKDKILSQEEENLKRLLGEDDEPEAEEVDETKKQIHQLMNKLINNFMETQNEVIKQSNENRNGLQEEIDHLHEILLNDQVKIRECELDTLAKLRQIQTDQTSNRVQLMDASAKMIASLKHFTKGDTGNKKAKGDDSLRSILGESIAD